MSLTRTELTAQEAGRSATDGEPTQTDCGDARNTNDMSVESIILVQITRIAEQQGKKLPPLTEDLPLLDSGFDSLCVATLVATLDEVLGIDPFSDQISNDFPVTIGEFISFYENALT